MPRCLRRKPPQYRSSSRISMSARDRSGPGSGTGRSPSRHRAGRARPSSIRARRRDLGIDVIRATGRPRSVMVTVSPAAASATTADAFCFRARIPTSDMCFNVAHWDGRATGQQTTDYRRARRIQAEAPEAVGPAYFSVKLFGSPAVRVRYGEVGLKDSDLAGVGGGT